MHVYPHTHTHTHCVPFLCRSCLTTPHTDELKAWGQKEHVSLKVDLVIQSKAVRLQYPCAFHQEPRATSHCGQERAETLSSSHPVMAASPKEGGTGPYELKASTQGLLGEQDTDRVTKQDSTDHPICGSRGILQAQMQDVEDCYQHSRGSRWAFETHQ